MQVKCEIVWLLLIAAIIVITSYEQFGTVFVIQSEMSPTMERYAVGQLLVILAEEKCFHKISRKLTHFMNQEYGKDWITIIDTNLQTAIIGMDTVEGTRLLVKYKDHQILLIKKLVPIDTTEKNSILVHVSQVAH